MSVQSGLDTKRGAMESPATNHPANAPIHTGICFRRFGAIVDAEDCDSTDSRCAGCEGRAMDAKRLGGLRLGLSSTSIGISICMSKKVGLREQQRNVKCFSTE